MNITINVLDAQDALETLQRFVTALTRLSGDAAVCADCVLPYRKFGLDSTLPDEQWQMIADLDGCLLCANCIVRRLSKIDGAVAVRMRLEVSSAETNLSPIDEAIVEQFLRDKPKAEEPT